jgi:SAM-dependent methyltransferase
VGFWLDLVAATPGPALELACGTGRITVPLAEHGTAIFGLDRAPVMLAALHRRRNGAPWPQTIAADMRQFHLARLFGAVFVAYNSLQLLAGPEEMVACLACARRHLAPGGLFGAEVTDFQAGGADGPAGAVDEVLARAGGISLSGRLVHDMAARTSTYLRRFSGPGWLVEDQVVLRSVDGAELAAVFEAAGLTVVSQSTQGSATRAVARAATPPISPR